MNGLFQTDLVLSPIQLIDKEVSFLFQLFEFKL